jgi:hypothetical protein
MNSAETRRRNGTQRFLAAGGLCLLCVLAAAAGCAQATARPRTDPIPLSIPEPPPRVVEQLPEVEELPAELPRREPTGTVGPARPQRASRENGTVAKAEPKTEPPKADPAPSPAEAPAVTPPSPTPARPELRTPETADEESAVREVRDTLERASKLLAKVDYRSLRRDARLQYDTAKRFIEQADEALKARNPVAAQYLAGKAETIAKGLGGR